MSTDLKDSRAAKLATLVESDFDQFLLLSLISQEPDESLYRTAYKALYDVDPADVCLMPAGCGGPPGFDRGR